jgi:hemerythrin-like domain-containing protein
MEVMEVPTRVLKDEHDVIKRVLRAFEGDVVSGNFNLERMENFVKFFRLFADACHHCKEEDILFPELELKGIPKDDGPIGVMLEEHRVARELVKRMGESIELVKGGNEIGKKDFFEAGNSYIYLLKDHIGKENQCLFEMARGALDKKSCEKIDKAYKGACNSFEGCSKDQLEKLADELERN